MPLYDYQCIHCDTRDEDVYFPLEHHKGQVFCWCPRHGYVEFEQVLAGPAAHDWGQGRYYEHVSATGETFYSKKQFREYCKRHGLRENSSFG